MQKQPEGRATETTNLGRLRRPANLLVYDNFHPLCSSCGDAETLLAGLWGRTLKAVRLPLQENLRNLYFREPQMVVGTSPKMDRRQKTPEINELEMDINFLKI